jgi:selenocysteine lyase/cysteine desulfurase
MNIDQIRQDTPGCAHKLFLNSAGSSLPPKVVNEKIIEYLQEEAIIGGYKLADQKAAEIQEFYKEAALLLNTRAENIAFASHATDAYAKALSAVPFEAGDIILTTDDDYVSNYLNFLSLQKRMGIRIVRAGNLPNGDLDLDHFRTLVKQHQPKLVAITHIPTSSGLVQDAESVGAICREYDCLYLLDACQSVGQLQVDVQQIGCDFLSATGRKFLRGPRGTGFLYISDRVLQEGYAPLFVDLRGAQWTAGDQYTLQHDARRFETWEVPYALLLGLKEAMAYANRLGIQQIEVYNRELMRDFRQKLSAIPGISLLDQGTRLGNILTLLKEGHTLEQTQKHLDQHQVLYSVAQKSSAQYDFDKKGIDWAIRLSPHYFNTREEMDRLAKLIADL